jgi:nitroreductase
MAGITHRLKVTFVQLAAMAPVAEQFSLPEHIVPVSMLVVGYPAKNAVPSERHEQRFPKEHMLLI